MGWFVVSLCEKPAIDRTEAPHRTVIPWGKKPNRKRALCWKRTHYGWCDDSNGLFLPSQYCETRACLVALMPSPGTERLRCPEPFINLREYAMKESDSPDVTEFRELHSFDQELWSESHLGLQIPSAKHWPSWQSTLPSGQRLIIFWFPSSEPCTVG